ncbi:MAG: glycosyltransferase family 39 protein [Thermodesulfobacteriota bacterium]
MKNSYSPTIRTASALFLIIAAVTVFLRLHSIDEPLERDHTTYGYIAHQMLAGDDLYVDVWDHKPPGVYWAYMLAETLWGYEPHGIIYIGILFTLVSLAFLFLFLREIAGTGTALVGALFWALASNSIALQANLPNTELFINSFTMMALWAFARYSGGKARYLVLSSFFLVVASTFKTVVVFPFAAFFLYLLLFPSPDVKRVTRLRGLALFLLPGFLVWGGVFGYFALKGTFPEFWEAVFVYNRYYAGNIWLNVWEFFTDPANLFHNSMKEVLPLVLLSGAWLISGRGKHGPLGRSFFILLVLGTLIAIAGPGKFYTHYYQLLLPPLVVMSALFFFEFDLAGYIARKEFPLRAWGVTAAFLLATGCLAYHQAAYLRMSPEEISARKYGHADEGFIRPRILAMRIKEITRPCDTIYEWGAETGLYYYSKRKAASGIFFVYPLGRGQPEKMTRDIGRVYDSLGKSPPAIFIWNNNYGKPGDTIFSPFLKNRYDLIGRYWEYDLYRYKHKTVCE